MISSDDSASYFLRIHHAIFIVIGYNEGEKLRKCFNSIYESISYNNLKSYEIIYVDSNSNDNSIVIAEEFDEVMIYRVTGYCNAAVGRNVGAKEAKGDIFFFIDGDREIFKEFLAEVLDANKDLKYNIVSGEVTDIEKNVTGFHITVEKKRFFMEHQLSDGGSFLVKKKIWISLKGMRTKFMNGEDGDFGLRLAKRGYQYTHIHKPVALHNTINYFDKQRIWKMVRDKSVFYCRCVLYRDHFVNKCLYPRIWNDDKTFLLLLLIFVSIMFAPVKFFFIGVILYLTAVFFEA